METTCRPGRQLVVAVLLFMATSCSQHKDSPESNVDAEAECTAVCEALWSCDFERPNCICHCTTAAELFTAEVFPDFVACVTSAPCDGGWDRPGDCLVQSVQLHLDEITESRRTACSNLAELMSGCEGFGPGDAAEFCAIANGFRTERWSPLEECGSLTSSCGALNCVEAAYPERPDYEFAGACPWRAEVDDRDAVEAPQTKRPGDPCDQSDLGNTTCGEEMTGQPAILVCDSYEDGFSWYVQNICTIDCVDGACVQDG